MFVAGAPDEAEAQRGGFLQVEIHASTLSDTPNASMIAPTFGYAVKAGTRGESWGAFVQFEHNLWVAMETEGEIKAGVFNVGGGVEMLSGRGFVRTSLAAGPSWLLFDTALDDTGTRGVFIDFRPVGLRWSANQSVVIALDPLSFAIMAPSLDGIPLIKPEYRTVLYVEVGL